MRLTSWYPSDTKPVREGFYQTQHYGWRGWSYWCGYWCNQTKTKIRQGKLPGDQNKQWRGLTYDYRG